MPIRSEERHPKEDKTVAWRVVAVTRSRRRVPLPLRRRGSGTTTAPSAAGTTMMMSEEDKEGRAATHAGGHR